MPLRGAAGYQPEAIERGGAERKIKDLFTNRPPTVACTSVVVRHVRRPAGASRRLSCASNLQA